VGLALGLNQVLSSLTHIIAKGATAAIGPLPVALIRFTIASSALLLNQRIRGATAPIAPADRRRLLLLGFLVVPINQGFFLFGLARSTASHASLLYALTPLVVLLLAGRMLGERALWGKLAGTLVAFAGVVIILFERGLRHEMGVLVGDILILIAVFAWGAYTVLAKPLLERHDAMTVTTWVIVSGTVMTLPAYLIPGAIPPLPTIPSPVWGGILYLAIGTSVIAYPLYMYALRHLEASKVAITTNIQPILTAILSWAIFGERFTPGFVLGALLVLAGVTWVETRKSPAPEPAEAAVAVEGERA
jgi:drug/metabolite transporter (DMT)-like permease